MVFAIATQTGLTAESELYTVATGFHLVLGMSYLQQAVAKEQQELAWLLMWWSQKLWLGNMRITQKKC